MLAFAVRFRSWSWTVSKLKTHAVFPPVESFAGKFSRENPEHHRDFHFMQYTVIQSVVDFCGFVPYLFAILKVTLDNMKCHASYISVSRFMP